MIDLNKQRVRREIDGAEYNDRTGALKEALDALFEQRDGLAEAQNTGALSMARRKMISELLEDERTRTEFDKDAFAKFCKTPQRREDIYNHFKSAFTGSVIGFSHLMYPLINAGKLLRTEPIGSKVMKFVAAQQAD